jgi:triacylglycerol esterase/lipase EstA (alpha/beta hydrolase family)
VIGVVLAVLAIGRGSDPGAIGPDARPGPVLLVSGYGGSTQNLSTLAATLTSAGRTVVVVPAVGDNTGDLHAQAAELDRSARSQLAAGARSVDVIGYSAGGVVARLWAAELGGTAVARRIVTLGSPHHGTDLAALAAGLAGSCPVACEQLAPDSDLLAGLADAPPGPQWISIWTADDDVVSPPSSAVLRGALDIELQQVCPTATASHGQLPQAALTQGLVLSALDGPRMTAVPTAASCTELSRPTH